MSLQITHSIPTLTAVKWKGPSGNTKKCSLLLKKENTVGVVAKIIMLTQLEALSLAGVGEAGDKKRKIFNDDNKKRISKRRKIANLLHRLSKVEVISAFL